MIKHYGVEVYLDNDQLKHQHPSDPIGTRITRAGNQFDPAKAGSKSWHKSTTLRYRAERADALGPMAEEEKIYHGQSVAVDGIHIEGFCTVIAGNKYVLFHCYPADT